MPIFTTMTTIERHSFPEIHQSGEVLKLCRCYADIKQHRRGSDQYFTEATELLTGTVVDIQNLATLS